MNEQKLIQKCKKNEYIAQMQVYHLYKDMMYNCSWRILKSREDAQDVVQDSFIKGFEKIHQKNETINLGAWLKRIVINQSLDLIRKRKKETWLEETNIVELIDETEDFENTTILSISKIKTCLLQLKDKYQIILNLYLIENYTHKEISEFLDLKESTVRNQYIRGKKQLQILLKTL